MTQMSYTSNGSILLVYTVAIFVLLLFTLNPLLSGHPRYGAVPLPGSMMRLLSQQVNKMAMTMVVFTAIFEGKRFY